jgi:hypothetical protein
MGNFDLYGNSYRTRLEAENAEMAQCAEIDARLAQQEVAQLHQEQRRSEYFLYERINSLEQRLATIEKLLNIEPNVQVSDTTKDEQRTKS